MSQIINAFVGQLDSIPYRKELREICGSVTASILFQQILYRAKGAGFKPFYKFKQPCSHDLYKSGDSWCEELGFSKKEFDTALKRIAQKVGANDTKDKSAFFWYWTTQDRRTYFEANMEAITQALDNIFLSDQRGFRKSTKGDLAKSPKGILESDKRGFTYNTENTTKEYQRESAPEHENSFGYAPPIDPAYSDLHQSVIAQGIFPEDRERLARMLQTHSEELNLSLNRIPKKEQPDAIARFISDPKHNGLVSGPDLRRRFRNYAGSWARNNNNARTGAGTRHGAPVSTSARLKRY